MEKQNTSIQFLSAVAAAAAAGAAAQAEAEAIAKKKIDKPTNPVIGLSNDLDVEIPPIARLMHPHGPQEEV